MTETPLQPVADAGSPSLGERITDVFVAPRRAMAATALKPAWWLPALLSLAIVGVFTAVNVHTITPAQLEAQLESAPAAQVPVLEQQLEMFMDPPTWLRVVTGLGAGVGVFVGGAVFAMICHLFLKLSEGRGRMGQSMGVTFWAGLIAYGLKSLLSWGVLVATGSVKAMSLTAVALLPDFDPSSMPAMIASFFGDPFLWWMLVVVVIGMARAHTLPTRSAATVVVATYALLMALMIGLQVVSKALTGA